MLLVLFASAVALSAVIFSAVKGAAPLRRRYSAVSDEEHASNPHTQASAADENGAAALRASIVPVGCVLTLMLGCVALLAGTQRSGVDPSTTCKAAGGPDRLLQLGDLHGFQLPIRTSSKLAQQLFNAGVLLKANFNQVEALHAFKMAAAADPAAAMPHWGTAYALGPDPNRHVTETRQAFPSFSLDDFKLAQAAAERGLHLAQAAAAAEPSSQVVQQDLAFATAVSHRFAAGSAFGPARAAAETTYAATLANIGQEFNISMPFALAAESYMNLSPWNYYVQPEVLRESAAKAEALIAQTLAQDPGNPLALHLYIHISEASNPLRFGVTAARAEASADRMTGPGPWQHSMGHLLHMPSHTFVRLGRWHDGVVANQHAYQADLNDSQHCRSPYVPEHNLEMLVYSANMGGEIGQALRYTKAMGGKPDDPSLEMRPEEGLGGWAGLPLLQSAHAMWADILAMPFPGATARGPCPGGGYEYSVAVYHYTRTMALAAACRAAPRSQACAQAEHELQLLKAADSKVMQESASVPGPWPGIWKCDYKNLSMIYVHTGTAAVAMQHTDFQLAEEQLRKAAGIEDVMSYQEPPHLLQPVRHALGSVLLQANKPAEAEQVYREDLAEHPVNGYSILGLSQSLTAQGKQQEADRLLAEDFKIAWKYADIVLDSSSPGFA